jgi:hypothetical protein
MWVEKNAKLTRDVWVDAKSRHTSIRVRVSINF